MITETTYLSEVKLRNRLRKDVIAYKIGAPVANASQRYSAGYIHVESPVGQDGWYEIRYYGRGWDNNRLAHQNAKISQSLYQMLHLLGYEVKIIERRGFLSGGEMERVALYRKAE